MLEVLGAAFQCLEELSSKCQIKSHGNIKPSNILLFGETSYLLSDCDPGRSEVELPGLEDPALQPEVESREYQPRRGPRNDFYSLALCALRFLFPNAPPCNSSDEKSSTVDPSVLVTYVRNPKI